MKEAEFRKLVKKDIYQIFLFSCPAPVPYNIALHHWFVINNKGKISRWDVLDWLSNRKESWGHLNKNFLKPTAGFNKYYWKLNSRTKSTFIAQISGKKGSLAKKMVKFIEQSPKKYLYCNKYRAIPGPNSNSYIQWIINKFPKSGFKLGWRAFGKNYKIKK